MRVTSKNISLNGLVILSSFLNKDAPETIFVDNLTKNDANNLRLGGWLGWAGLGWGASLAGLAGWAGLAGLAGWAGLGLLVDRR